jgi:hypothetical protein
MGASRVETGGRQIAAFLLAAVLFGIADQFADKPFEYSDSVRLHELLDGPIRRVIGPAIEDAPDLDAPSLPVVTDHAAIEPISN